MKTIKLNPDYGKLVQAHGYELSAIEQYVIDLEAEKHQQTEIAQAVSAFGLPPLKDYHRWLQKNGFDVNFPNPTNEVVAKYYGNRPLWSTELSQGIAVKAINENDYYIVMECSRLNEGFKYTQIILTLGGCL